MAPKPKQPEIPPAPSTLGAAGKAYWRTVQTDFNVEPHHYDLLLAACQQLDRAESARQVIAKEGVTSPDRFGQIREHAAVGVERAAHLAFLRISRELGLDVMPAESRGPRRPGTRN